MQRVGDGYRPGGCYLRGGWAGIYAGWSWVLGAHHGEGVTLRHRPYGLCSLAVRETLIRDRIVYVSEGGIAGGLHSAVPEAGFIFRTSPNIAPLEMADKCQKAGFGIHIGAKVAMEVALTGLPVPIFFSGSLPYFECYRDMACILGGIWGIDLSSYWVHPTWWRGGWGLEAGDRRGDDHYMVKLMRILSQEPEYTEVMPRYEAVVYGASWIKEVIYVSRTGLADDIPEDLALAGVEVAVRDGRK